jgi:prolyl-tRNA synthetase
MSNPSPELSAQLKAASEHLQQVRSEVGKFIVGQRELVHRLLVGLVARGHILLEGLPGLAKSLTVSSLARAIGGPFRPATPEEIREAFGAEPGSIGAVGLREGAVREVIVDPVLTTGAYLTGANRTGWHLHGAEFGRDFTGRVVDIRHVEEGELSVETGSPLRIEPAIEVGNIFQLGTRYSDALGAKYLDESGVEQSIWMGSYGIGPARTMA